MSQSNYWKVLNTSVSNILNVNTLIKDIIYQDSADEVSAAVDDTCWQWSKYENNCREFRNTQVPAKPVETEY